MRIGEIAALIGVTPRAVRHYHHLGLLPEPVRRSNGYREYGIRDAVLLGGKRSRGSCPSVWRGTWPHEARVLASLVRWMARRPHGVGEADGVFPHARDQAATMYGLTFVCVAETVALSFLLARWPVVHAVLLVVDVYTVLFVLGMHAAAVTRPHVLAGGVLRVRQAAHVDIRIPVALIASVRRESLFTHTEKDGELNLPIGSQTSLALELTEPVNAPKLLGAPRPVRVIRLHADDPKSLYDAVSRARTTPAPAPQDAD